MSLIGTLCKHIQFVSSNYSHDVSARHELISSASDIYQSELVYAPVKS